MLSYLFGIIASAGALAALGYCAAAGFRNGDRPGDALVSAAIKTAAQAGERHPVIVATVRNPSATPVLAALRARRGVAPAWLAGPLSRTAPRRTVRRKFRPGGFATVGVVPAEGAAEFAVPVPLRARRYLLTAAVGQDGGRLRVHRLRLDGTGTPLRRPRIYLEVS